MSWGKFLISHRSIVSCHFEVRDLDNSDHELNERYWLMRRWLSAHGQSTPQPVEVARVNRDEIDQLCHQSLGRIRFFKRLSLRLILLARVFVESWRP